jgi:sarcosine oxidase subunit beta
LYQESEKGKSVGKVKTDVLIIGSGVVGSSIAYHLAREGVRVLVVERSQVAQEPVASWASAGGVRRQGRHPAEAALASAAIARWPSLEQELEADLHYRQGGNLLVAESAEEADELTRFVQLQQHYGFTDVRLLDRQEIRELVPGLNKGVLAGSYSVHDGQADPARTTRAFANAAIRHGATYWTETRALALLGSDGRVGGARVVRSDIEEIEAGHVVLAAGAWSDELAASIGLRLPIRMQALQMLRSSPATTDLLRPVLSALGRSLSLKQLPDGAFLLGGGWPGTIGADRHSYILRTESIDGNWTTASELFPAVAQQRMERAWCGLEAESIDEIPFIGALPGWQGLTLALGFSGHGFALSPSVGQSVADQIVGRPSPMLGGLKPDRMAHFTDAEIDAFLASTDGGSAG